MSFKLSKLLLILIFVVALGLRLYQLSFFQFQNDQLMAIKAGQQTCQAHFLITHGMGSGTGLENPPEFYYAMGLLTAVTSDPRGLTFFFFLMNILALAVAIYYFYRTLPLTYAVLSSAFLALLPAFNIYSNYIWAQCLLPLPMILFNICLYQMILHRRWQNFFYLGVLAFWASGLHGSGFLLFLLLLIIAIFYWRSIDRKMILWTVLVVFILFIPFIIHLFKEMEINRVLAYGASGTRGFQWKIFPFHYRMASFEFFRTYFKFDFTQILKIIVGPWRFILYPLTFIPGILFVVGFIYYLQWLMKGKLFDTSKAALRDYPLPFQISGLMLLVITIQFLVLRVSASQHYCIVLFPVYSVLCAFAAMKIWQFAWGKLIVILGLLASLILLVGVLNFVDRAGGHPYQYGLDFKTMLAWRQEIQALKGPGECLDIRVDFPSKDSSDAAATQSVLNQPCAPTDKLRKVDIHIIWNKDLMRYQYTYAKNINH